MAATEVEGITPLNLKDVVTDNFLCTGGKQPHRENIACKGMLTVHGTLDEAFTVCLYLFSM